MTRTQFNTAYDGQMIEMACENHPDVRYSCKRIAVNTAPDSKGKHRYNGRRNIFDNSETTCNCPIDAAYAVIEENSVQEG